MVIVGLSHKLGGTGAVFLDDGVSERWFLGPTERYYRTVKVTKYFLKFKKIYIQFKETEKVLIMIRFLNQISKKNEGKISLPLFFTGRSKHFCF